MGKWKALTIKTVKIDQLSKEIDISRFAHWYHKPYEYDWKRSRQMAEARVDRGFRTFRTYIFQDGETVRVPDAGFLKPDEIKSYEKTHGCLNCTVFNGNITEVSE